MTASIPELIQQLDSADGDTRAQALAALVARGGAATRDLEAVLVSANPRLRARATQALSEVADPAAAETLVQSTYDSDEEVRARSAYGLSRMDDRRAIDALLRTFDDFPDVLHHPFTLSSYGLIGLGIRALRPVAPLLKSPQPVTRQRAFAVIQAVVSSLPEGRDWPFLWRSLGSYDPDAAAAERDRGAEQWIEWTQMITA